MDTIYHAVNKLERGETPSADGAQQSPAWDSDAEATSAETQSTAGALVPLGPTLERMRESPWALTCRHATIVSTPFTLEELSLENLAAPESSERCYEELVANFHSRYDAESIRTILFVGAGEGHGCSTTAFNFAATLSRTPHTAVLFVDGNFRTVRTRRPAGARPVPQLSSLALPWPEALLPVVPVQGISNLFVAPSGDAGVAPLTLFRSVVFETFMREMSNRFSHIVIDAPPLQEAPESVFLASKADGVVLVLDCNRGRRSVARRLKDTIESAGGRLLGTVLNQRRYYIPDWLYRKL